MSDSYKLDDLQTPDCDRNIYTIHLERNCSRNLPTYISDHMLVYKDRVFTVTDDQFCEPNLEALMK